MNKKVEPRKNGKNWKRKQEETGKTGRNGENRKKQEETGHSWFAAVVDGNELGPVYPFQLNQLKYEDPKDEGAVGATMDFMVDFGIDIHIPLQKIESHVRSSLRQGVPG